MSELFIFIEIQVISAQFQTFIEFQVIPILLALLSLIGPIIHWKSLKFTVPFDSFISRFSTAFPSSGHTDLHVKPNMVSDFNGTNPIFNSVKRNSFADFGFILKTRFILILILNIIKL